MCRMPNMAGKVGSRSSNAVRVRTQLHACYMTWDMGTWTWTWFGPLLGGLLGMEGLGTSAR